MIRLLLILTIAAVIAYFGSTVKLGQRTFFGHVRAIWSTDEAQDMRKGLGEKAGPALDRMKRGVEAGIKAATGDDAGPGEPAIDGGPIDAPLDPPSDGAGLPAEALPAEPARPAKPGTPARPAKEPKRDGKKHGVTMIWPTNGPTNEPTIGSSTAPTSSSAPMASVA
jgi:hypothetical protein